MVLTNEFLFAVAAYVTEFLIRIDNLAGFIGDTDDIMLIECLTKCCIFLKYA